jgi:hypothetical protein
VRPKLFAHGLVSSFLANELEFSHKQAFPSQLELMTNSEIYQHVVNTLDDMLKTVDDFGGAFC